MAATAKPARRSLALAALVAILAAPVAFAATSPNKGLFQGTATLSVASPTKLNYFLASCTVSSGEYIVVRTVAPVRIKNGTFSIHATIPVHDYAGSAQTNPRFEVTAHGTWSSAKRVTGTWQVHGKGCHQQSFSATRVKGFS
ncbi:MAG: hypothetical protein M3065_10070 [Actinomycetota bacterium]|nr:hypothetical protein [Actinomycetota bacterium]